MPRPRFTLCAISKDGESMKARPRSRVRITLRALFALLTIACVGIGWYASLAYRQRAVVRAIKEAGGECRYGDDHYFTFPRTTVVGSGPTARTVLLPPFSRDRLRRFLGDDWYSNVTLVSFQGKTFDNEQLSALIPELASLPNLRRLELMETAVTGAGLQPLVTLHALEHLRLFDTKIRIDDPGLLSLRKQLPELRVGY